MTLSELRNKIAEVEDKTWFLESTTAQIHYPHINFQIELKGIPAIYEFISRQSKGWNELSSKTNLPDFLQASKNNFNTLSTRIADFVTRNANTPPINRNNTWAGIKEQIQKQAHNNTKILISDSAEAEFLIDFNKKYPNSGLYAFRFLVGEQINTSSFNHQMFIGIIRAYEFRLQGSSIKKRRENEKKSLGKIRSDYNQYIGDAEKDLNEHLTKSSESVESYAATIDSLLESKKKTFDQWFEETKKTFTEFDDGAKKSMSDNEELYKEKLKLEAPATYWRDRATKLRGEGIYWLIALIVTSVISVVALGLVLFFISDGTLKDLFDKSGSAVRWSIVFVTFVSFLLFNNVAATNSLELI